MTSMNISVFGRTMKFTPIAVAALFFLSVRPTRASAQQGKSSQPEFTRQDLLIVNFTPRAGADMKLGRNAGNALRSRIGRFVNGREVEIVDGNEIEWQMQRAGYDPDTIFAIHDIHSIGQLLRADEYVLGYVSNNSSGPRMSGELVLMRDERLRQPLQDAAAPKLDSAAQIFARSLAAARSQLTYERRCENNLREGRADDAIAVAREGVAAYPHSTIARTCLVWALRQRGSPSTEVLAVAQEILAIDSTSFHAIDAAAAALDSLRRRDQAAAMWLRLARTDTSNMDLALRVSLALFDGGNATRAEPFITAVSDAYPDDIRLVQQKWRIAYENKNWAHALAAAEVMLERDSVAKKDSTFYLRLATAYRAASRPYRAIEVLARSVAAFPNDPRLYSLYSQYIRAEADTVVPRGLALFPKSADLLAMNAKELRAKGKIAESLDATKKAVALDSTMTNGQLSVAQLEIELGRPDSALAALHRALATGDDSALIAQFALAKGNSLYRAASGTKTSNDFGLAFRFLVFADTVRSSSQSKFLIGAAALGIAQSAVTEATKVADKVESCRLTRLSADMLPVARTGLQAGEGELAEAAKQSLDFLQQLDPYVTQQLTTNCSTP
jgi:tetratricopeptide (TPR) repeat protein